MPWEASTIEGLVAQADGKLVSSLLVGNAAAEPDGIALRSRDADGSWTELTWAGVADRAARLATALGRLGLGAGDRAMLLMRTRPEFHWVDLGILAVRGTPVSIYNSSSPEQIAYLGRHCGAKLAVVDGIDFLERLLKVRDEMPDLQTIVIVDDPDGLAPADVLRLADLVTDEPADLAALCAAAEPDDLVTVIYTSGTTGPPKGVMLDHSNVMWQLASYSLILRPPMNQRTISYLPMAHIAERIVTHYDWLWQRRVVTTCPDLRLLGEYLVAVRPDNIFGPPRVWEKLRAGIMAAVGAGGAERVAGFERALAVGGQVDALRRAGAPVPAELAAVWSQLEETVFRPLRARVGLDEMRYAYCGAAPLPAEVFAFFRAIGVPFSEVYGMSENTGGMTWDPWEVRPGTVGRPYPAVEMRIAEDGEILCRGRIISRGYLNDPDRTADTFDPDGWLHTGDIGSFDADGYLSIVDRKKELIITAGGKNISPANIEAELKSLPLVGQACVVGDRRPYLVALLVLDPETAPVWAASLGLPTSLAELATEPAVRAELDRGVAEVNAQFSNVESVKRFAVLGAEWLPDSPQLTPTMKLKRRGVLAEYADVIEALYAPVPEPAAPAGAAQPAAR